MPSKRREAHDYNKRGEGLKELLADNMTDKNATGKRIRDDDSVAEDIQLEERPSKVKCLADKMWFKAEGKRQPPVKQRGDEMRKKPSKKSRGRKTAPARKALEKSRAPLTIDENDSGYNQESEASGDDDEFTGENKLEEDEEVEDEDSDVEMEDNELLNERAIMPVGKKSKTLKSGRANQAPSLTRSSSGEEIAYVAPKVKKDKASRSESTKYEDEKIEIGRDVPLGKVKVEKENVAGNHGFNSKWTEETWITPPQGNSLISKSIQSENIQILLERGIDGLIALQLFVDALPNSDGRGKTDNKEESQRLQAILKSCKQLGLVAIKQRIEHDRLYCRFLTDYCFNRVCLLRGKFKQGAAQVVETHFFPVLRNLKGDEKAEIIRKLVPKLTGKLEYVFPIEFDDLTDLSNFKRIKNRPYGQPALISIIHFAIFSAKKNSPADIFDNLFTSSIEDKNDEKEIPIPMMCLAAVALYDALLDWSTGYEVKNRKFKLEELSGQYDKNKKFLATFKSEPAKYHRMMANAYVEAKGTPINKRPDAMTLSDIPDDVDFEGMAE